jgi:hypothetical protein
MPTENTDRHEGLVTSLSWIPSEAIEGAQRLAFDSGITHYDAPPPSEGINLEELRIADRFRFANELRAWIDVDNAGRITDCGYSGGGQIGSTTVSVAGLRHKFEAVQLPDIQREPEFGDGWVRFVQTTGGRTGLPAPRRVRRRPFVQWQAPLVWTTLSLTLHADGRCERALTGASRFPRHWVYDGTGTLSHKSGLTDFKDWYRQSFGRHTPWGDQDSEALGEKKVAIERFPAGGILAKQGELGTEVFLVLDGVIRVEHDGERLAEYGPGALLGERAHLGDGARTSTLEAVTPCRVAVVEADRLERSDLLELSEGHRREDQARY